MRSHISLGGEARREMHSVSLTHRPGFDMPGLARTRFGAAALNQWKAAGRRFATAVTQKLEHFANSTISAVRFGQWHMGLDFVAVPAPLFGLCDVAGIDQVCNDVMGSTFGDIQACCNIAEAYIGIPSNAQQGPAMVGQKAPARHGDER